MKITETLWCVFFFSIPRKSKLLSSLFSWKKRSPETQCKRSGPGIMRLQPLHKRMVFRKRTFMISHEHGKPPTFCQWHKASDRCQEMTQVFTYRWHEASSVWSLKLEECQWLKKMALKHFHDQRWYKGHCGLTEIEEHVFKNTFYTRLTSPLFLGLASGCIMLFLKILYINQNCINSKVVHRNVNVHWQERGTVRVGMKWEI